MLQPPLQAFLDSLRRIFCIWQATLTIHDCIKAVWAFYTRIWVIILYTTSLQRLPLFSVLVS